MIKTFRGLLASGGQDRIRLSTKKGKIGYRIVKFQAITTAPGDTTAEAIVKIFKIKQTAIDALVNFSDGNLLGMVYWTGRSSTVGTMDTIIFDKEIFNQDIYVTAKDVDGSDRATSYYIELEVMSLTDNAAAVSTLRDIRLNPQVGA